VTNVIITIIRLSKASSTVQKKKIQFRQLPQVVVVVIVVHSQGEPVQAEFSQTKQRPIVLMSFY
jgi:hypothetical protein